MVENKIEYGLINCLIGTFSQLPNKAIARENQAFEPSQTAEHWAKIRYMPSDTAQATLCKKRISGLFQITLYSQANTGGFAAKRLAERIAQHYGTQEQIAYQDVTITITHSQREQGLNTTEHGANWYAIPVSVYFYADV